MADFIPTFKIYDSSNTSLVYTFEYIIPPIIGWPSDNPASIEHTNLRSSGAITIPEGNNPYDIILNGVLIADNYTALTTQIFALRDTIVANTKYVLRLDKSVSTYDSINVMRKTPIVWNEEKRVNIQRYTIQLQALAWQ